MSSKFIIGIKELNSIIQKNQDMSFLLIFTASWCGPCQRLKSQLFKKDSEGEEVGLITNYKDKLIVLYIDVDEEENEELMNIYKVNSMPTQILIKINYNQSNNSLNIDKIGEISGCDLLKLKDILNKNL